MNAEKLTLYRATLARLEQQVAGLRARRRQLPRLFLAGVALSPLALVLGRWAPLWVVLGSGAIVGVGYYIVLMHIEEDTAAIEGARAVIDELAAEDDSGEAV